MLAPQEQQDLAHAVWLSQVDAQRRADSDTPPILPYKYQRMVRAHQVQMAQAIAVSKWEIAQADARQASLAAAEDRDVALAVDASNLDQHPVFGALPDDLKNLIVNSTRAPVHPPPPPHAPLPDNHRPCCRWRLCQCQFDVMPMPMREWTREWSPGGWT